MINFIKKKIRYINYLKDTIDGQSIAISDLKKIIDEKSSDIKKLKSYIGYIINEQHIVFADHRGNYIPIFPEKISKYDECEIVEREQPPTNIVCLYAKAGTRQQDTQHNEI